MSAGSRVSSSDGGKRRLPLLRYLLTGSGQYASRLLRDWVKVLLRRPLNIDERAVFFRKFVLHRTGLRRISKITCAQRSGVEGAAAQAHLIVNAINFARVVGIAYVHTPFNAIGHADRPMQQWAAAWETLFNLGAGEIGCDVEDTNVVNYGYDILDDLDLCFSGYCQREHQTRRFKDLIPDLRRKYYQNRSPRTTTEVTVAVHIRRGDVPARNSDLFTRTEVILQTLRSVKSALDSQPIQYSIRVYSQGKVADFTELSPLGVEFFLNADAIWTMQELIEADILILAKSSFSYYAGLISDGIKIFEPQTISPATGMSMPSWEWMLRSPADDWIPSQPNGAIDHAAFDRQLAVLMQSKPAQDCPQDAHTLRLRDDRSRYDGTQ